MSTLARCFAWSWFTDAIVLHTLYLDVWFVSKIISASYLNRTLGWTMYECVLTHRPPTVRQTVNARTNETIMHSGRYMNPTERYGA